MAKQSLTGTLGRVQHGPPRD